MVNRPVRIIARLDIKGPNLVKGVHLEGLRVLGRPEEFAEYYYNQGIDELFYMDVVASLYERNSLSSMIKEIAKKIFIPLTVGGGIRTIDDINTVLRSGADKVCINSAAIRNPEFIKQAIKKFGSTTIVAGIEAIQQRNGNYLASVDNGREFTDVEVLNWARRLQELGVGEIVITSVDKEGAGTGFDLNLVQQIAKIVDIPIVVHGGAGCIEDISELFIKTNVSAVALASILHYHFIDLMRTFQGDILETTEGNFSFLKGKANFTKINPCEIKIMKQHLTNNGICCRL